MDLGVGSIETQLLQTLLDLSGINLTWIGGGQETDDYNAIRTGLRMGRIGIASR